MDHVTDESISQAASRIYHLLWKGDYMTAGGRRLPVHGDLSKVHLIVGLNDTERALLANYHFMSARLAGTRQLRRGISHMLFSSRVIYGGCPIFITITPSERHSGLIIRLSRYRRNDPGLQDAYRTFLPFAGFDEPSLSPDGKSSRTSDEEMVTVDFPEYDMRKCIGAKDPLACMLAFWVNVRVIFANLYGLRICPRCPDCVESDCPCMDRFGSNASVMGGSLGRLDAGIGAVEAQKKEGVLHLHMYVFAQMVNQFNTLADIAVLLREGLLSVDAIKRYVSFSRSAAYPDLAKFEAERSSIEAAWPAYVNDISLSRAPLWAFQQSGIPALPAEFNSKSWLEDGSQWNANYYTRLQHSMSRMNYHIHPMVNTETGERKPLTSCNPKGRPKECKGGFPLDNEVCEEALLVCECLADKMQLQTTGPKSLLGSVLPYRNAFRDIASRS